MHPSSFYRSVMIIPFYLYINLLFIILWLIFKPKLRQYPLLIWLGYLMIFNFCVEVAATIYAHYTQSNHWIYNIYTTLQIVFIALIYKNAIYQKLSLKKKYLSSCLFTYYW